MSENIPKIKLFSYINKDNQVEDIQLNYGQKWSEIKTDNETINSIFAKVSNGKETVEPRDLNILNKVFLFADNLADKTSGNEILENEELEKLKEKINNKEIDLNNLPETKPDIKNWSEGTDRIITKLYICEPYIHEDGEINDQFASIIEALQRIAEVEGFEIERKGHDIMMEDPYVRRPDGNYYIQYYTDTDNKNGEDNRDKYLEKRYQLDYPGQKFSFARDIDDYFGAQGAVAEDKKSFMHNLPKNKLVYGASYLEGGNVLNTLKKDGTPGAIIGEESIGYTLNVMGLSNTPENIEIAKQQIAIDLGIKEEDVTYIPQFGYHIDMLYRPLHNGDIAIPDFSEGIKIEKDRHSNKERIKEIKDYAQKTKVIRREAEQILKQAGYELVKIPCFEARWNLTTNYMNGITGTSPKTGKSFYITNSSSDEKLDEIVKKYFENAGIDHVYFLDTFENGLYANDGAIDCMTQEE